MKGAYSYFFLDTLSVQNSKVPEDLFGLAIYFSFFLLLSII
jgi:hypothetical protein